MTPEELSILANAALDIDGDTQLAILLYTLAGARMMGRGYDLAVYVQDWAKSLQGEIEAYKQWVELSG